MMANAGGQYSVHAKKTDRPSRQYDDYEITCVSDFNPDHYDYVYQTYGHRYGISADQIRNALKKQQHHFIICNDISTIRALKRDFGAVVKVVFHYFDAPITEIRRIQEDRNISDDEIELRIAKTSLLYRQFVEEWQLFDAALVNNYGNRVEMLKERMEKLLADLATKEASDHLIGKLTDVANELERRSFEKRRNVFEKNYAFVIMPIREDDSDNEDVHRTIARV